jgi:phosphoenolpyruvate carboxykinase (ATP)
MTETMVADLPAAKTRLDNPDPAVLRELTEQMETARVTEFNNVNVTTEVLSRLKSSTFLVSDEPVGTHQVMTRAAYDVEAARQDEYIATRDMVLIDGWIGNDSRYRVAARLYIEASHANIAGMQQMLFFDAGEHGPDVDQPLTVIYTPTLTAPDFPDSKLIAVDYDGRTTRVFASDYFGESKKGNLRMWNRLVYERGGLPLHAGAKVVPTQAGGKHVMLIVGLSGTGKTTTTFTRQNGSLPIQDDFVAWWPDGHVSSTEAGCFAKTFGLSMDDEPTIFTAVTRSDAYLENVSQSDDGKLDFFDTSYTKNGRAVFSFSSMEHADARDVDVADTLLILNKNENIIPAVARLTPEQAAAYFMLGETTGTSAGGADEEGKFLRVPGTNPFFPMSHGLQGNRFLELMRAHPLNVYVMNTGRVGGKDNVEGSLKVRIAHSSAIVEAIAEGTIEWTVDPDFGYEVATKVPGIDGDDFGVLQPRELYERLGRLDEYTAFVERIKAERSQYLRSFGELDPSVRDAVR